VRPGTTTSLARRRPHRRVLASPTQHSLPRGDLPQSRSRLLIPSVCRRQLMAELHKNDLMPQPRFCRVYGDLWEFCCRSEPLPFVGEITLVCSLMKAAFSTSAPGSPGSTRTVTLETQSTGGNIKGNTHDPTTAIEGTALSEGLVSRSSPFAVGVALDFPPPMPLASTSLINAIKALLSPPSSRVNGHWGPDFTTRSRRVLYLGSYPDLRFPRPSIMVIGMCTDCACFTYHCASLILHVPQRLSLGGTLSRTLRKDSRQC